MRGFLQVIGTLAAYAISGMLWFSCYSHLFSSYPFLESVLNYRLAPVPLAAFAAAWLPALQLVLGTALLLLPQHRRAALKLSLLLFTFYITIQVIAWQRGLDITCGCFGKGEERIGWKTISPAIAGFVLSILGLFTYRHSPMRTESTTQPLSAARAGFTLVEVLVVIAILAILLGILLAAVQRVRAAAARTQCLNKMKQVNLALHQYMDANGCMPAGLSLQAYQGKKPFLGWTAMLLPYLEQQAKYSQIETAFKADLDTDLLLETDYHRDLLKSPVNVFNCPADGRLPGPQTWKQYSVSFTSYLGVSGRNQFLKDGVLYLDSQTRFSDITDGTSNTLAFGERPPSHDFRLGWWYRGWGFARDGSGDMFLSVFEKNKGGVPSCPEKQYPFSPDTLDNPCAALHYWSLHSGGAHFGFCDGSVRFLKYSADPMMAALSSRARGDAVELD
jgi:prepilin-type N-terminal cleavage/methylation domain-containing protein/prepilin-type processing-associated H-X9-DG protein